MISVNFQKLLQRGLELPIYRDNRLEIGIFQLVTDNDKDFCFRLVFKYNGYQKNQFKIKHLDYYGTLDTCDNDINIYQMLLIVNDTRLFNIGFPKKKTRRLFIGYLENWLEEKQINLKRLDLL